MSIFDCAREICGSNFGIAVDGGINKETIHAAAKAGADTFVAGSAVFRRADRKQAIDELRAALA